MRVRSVYSSLCLLLLTIGFVSSCSSLKGESQFVNKVTSPSFVTELYNTTTQTITVRHEKDQHISWMGFVQSHDFRYFKIKKVEMAGQTIVEDGKTIAEEEYIATSTSIIEDINVSKSAPANNEFVNGSINVAGASDLRITIEYSPLKAIKSGDVPHLAYLIIYYDKPQQGAMRVKINGFTQGVKAEKCAQPLETMLITEYSFKNDAFDLYLCATEVANTDQDNTPKDPLDPGYHGLATNLASVPVVGNFIFYQPDEETVCILSQPEPSVPAFDLPVPPGLGAPLPSLPVEMQSGSFAECKIDSAGVFVCDGNLNIKTLVPVSKLSMTNGAVAAEDLVTSECTDFGAIAGAGAVGDDDLTLIVHGRVLSDANTEQFNITDAQIVGKIVLTK